MTDLFGPVCDLKIIEAMPEIGDYPYQAAEYLIPGERFRLSGAADSAGQISSEAAGTGGRSFYRHGRTCQHDGSRFLFEYGIDEMDGFVVKDNSIAERSTRETESLKIYASGQKVSLRKTEYDAFRKAQNNGDLK